MYCPICGSNNQSGTKFCARCGTNVAVVTDALAGKGAGPSVIDERIIKLIKDYHRGRRDAVTGGILIPAGLLLMSILVAAGMNPIASFFIICWMFFWGASSLASGVGKWVASSGEMKSLGFAPLLNQEHSAPLLGRPPQAGYSTGPIGHPASVTEQTTRQLEHRPKTPSRENQSKSSD
jgi:hypothetical protein